MILAGGGPAFSVGADLVRVLAEGEEYLRAAQEAMNAAISALFLFPRPVVAAVNGHAIAGGCVLVCASDHRIAADGDHRIGLAELRVGVPFPTWALEIVRFAAVGPHLQEALYPGRLYRPAVALDRGLVDEVVDAARLLDRAREVAEGLMAIPAGTFRHTKDQLRRPVADRVRAASAEQDRDARELWGSEEVRGAIARFLAELAERSGPPA